MPSRALFFSSIALTSGAVLGACSSTESKPIPAPTVVGTTPDDIQQVVRVGGDVFCVTTGAKTSIVRFSLATGASSTYLDDASATALFADDSRLFWIATNTSTTGLLAAPLTDGSAATLLADGALGAATDGQFVYYATQKPADFPDVTFEVWRVPSSGGSPTALFRRTEDGADPVLAVDDADVYFAAHSETTTNWNLYAVPKGGGEPRVVAEDIAGLDGAEAIAVDGDRVAWVGDTGGGATGNFLKSVPKAGGEKAYLGTNCQTIKGIAAAGGFVYATCDADIESFKVTRRHTVLKIPAGGGSAEVIAQLYPEDDAGGDPGFTAPALDDSFVYVGYGSKLLKTPR